MTRGRARVARTPEPHATRVVTVRLDKPRHLRFTLGAVRRILKEKGGEFLELTATASIAEGLERVSYLLWQGLIWEDRELTQDEVDELVDFSQFEELTNAVLQALGVAMPKKKEVEADDEVDDSEEEGAGSRPTTRPPRTARQ